MEAVHLDGTFSLVLVVVMFAAVVKATLGFGFPLISVPIAATLLGARTAVVLIAVPVVVVNFAALLRGGGPEGALRRVAGLLGGIVVGTTLGAQFLNRLDPRWLALTVGATGLIFALVILFNVAPAIPPHTQSSAGTGVGFVSGVLGGTTGIFAPIVAPYIHSLGVTKRVFVYWLAASFMLGGLVQVLNYVRLGLYAGAMPVYALVTCLPAVAGTLVGFRIQDRLSARIFRRGVLLLVLVSSLNLLLRNLF